MVFSCNQTVFCLPWAWCLHNCADYGAVQGVCIGIMFFRNVQGTGLIAWGGQSSCANQMWQQISQSLQAFQNGERLADGLRRTFKCIKAGQAGTESAALNSIEEPTAQD